MAQKLFEIKGGDWLKGLALQGTVPIGGLFRAVSNFDPYAIMGCMAPAYDVTNVSGITAPLKFMAPITISGTNYVIGQGTTKAYKVLQASPYTATDITSSLVFDDGAGGKIRGAINYQGSYVYALATKYYAFDGSTNTLILNGTSSSQVYHPMCVGADTNLYVGDGQSLDKITSVTGTAGNSTGAVTIEPFFIVRELVSDGRYLVILADNNRSTLASEPPNSPSSGTFRCQVYFWNMVAGTFEQKYEFADSYIAGAAYKDGLVHIIGANNYYVCNIATPPKPIYNFATNPTFSGVPILPNTTLSAGGFVYWPASTTSNAVTGPVEAFGTPNPTIPPTFFSPVSVGQTQNAIFYNGTNLFHAVQNTPYLTVSNSAATKVTGSISTCFIPLNKPHKYDFVKVILQDKMSSGASVTSQAVTRTGSSAGTISATDTWSYNSSNPQDTHLFYRKPAGNSTDIEYFDDFSITITSNCTIKKIELWGTPQDEQRQQ